MYIKVYIENNQLFREDNGSLIGEAVFPVLFPTYSLYECNKEITNLLYGYMDTKGSFNELCSATGCSFACLSERKPNCRYVSKGGDTEGFYVKSFD